MAAQNYSWFRFLSAVTLTCGLGSAYGADVTLEPFSPHSPEGFSVTFAASPEPIAAMQFDLEFDSSAAALFPSSGAAIRSSNKMLTMEDLGSNRKRFVIYGLNTSGIAGGRLVDVAVSPRSSRPIAVRVLDVKAVSGNGAPAIVNIGTAELNQSADASSPLTPSTVWNAASVQAAPVSAGAIMTLRGLGIGADPAVPKDRPAAFSLEGTKVTFDGISAPLLYVGLDQINVVAPWALTNRTETRIAILRNSVTVAEISAAVRESAPEIFTLTSTGTGNGAVINQDGTVNTPLSPAARDSIVSIYGTGLGPFRPSGRDGELGGFAYADSDVSVTIDGIPAEVTYAGTAPSLISGAFQVNCRVPSSVRSGPDVEIRVKSGATQSSPGVTISVR